MGSLRNTAVSELLAKDLLSGWLDIARFKGSEGMWVDHVLPAVLVFLREDLKLVVDLPEEQLKKEPPHAKVKSDKCH